MINEDSETSSGKDEDHLVPAFGVSGQFMMTSEEKAIPSDDFNPRKIVALTLDDSLARLFECLTLEYSGSILLTPKWKNFRSQKLKFAEKTRINNAIWRSWHIQFQMGQRPLFCQFDNPLTEMAKPPKPVTLMVEGKYWKRKLEVVAAEYQKWRVFYKQMVEDKFQDVELQHQTKEILRLDQEISDNLREREKERKYNVGNPNRSFQDTQSPLSLVVSQALEMVDSCNLMESMVFSLPDTLFTSLEDENQRVGKVTSRTFKDTADTVQPTLDTLQPSLEAMTPVLDELIEQLEASMKGSELNWDFPTLERNIDLPQMGLVQSSTGQEQVETMDHSGRYDEPCRPVGSQSLPSSGTSSWPMQTSSVPSQPMFVGSSQSQPRPESQVWTSSLGIHPGVMGVQTVGTEVPRSYVQTNATRPRSFSSNATSVVDIGELPGVSASPVITSRPYLSTPLISKRSAASAGLRHSIAVGLGSGRMPRNSSDSQLYLLSTSESSPSRSRVQTTVPVEVQAPNLVAQLKLSTKARPSLTEEKAKRPRLPRNRSAPGLASLEASALLKKAPQAGGVRAKRLGKIPRNRSDSSLASMIRQSEKGSSRQRRESESGDLLMTHSPSEEVTNATTTQAYPRRNMIPFVVGSPPLAPAMSGCEEGASSQLVNEMVTHLMSKGISMEEILGKLTAMATVGSTHPSHMLSSQTTSLTSSVASIRQDPQVMQTSIAKRQVTPFLSTTTTVSSTQFSDTRSDTPRIAPSRSRRKPQTPRPSLKITQTECTAVNEPSGSRSTDDIIQNILSRNRQEFQTAATSRVPAIDPLSMRESTTVGSVPLWGNTETTSLFNHNRGLGTSSSPPRSIVSQPLAVQIAGTQMSFPTMIQGSTGDVMLQDASTVDKQLHGLRSFAVSNSGLTSSMMMSTPPAMTMTVSEASPSSGTIETNKAEGSTSSALRGNYKAETETPVRSRPLTKTLPKDQYMEHRRMVHVSAEQKRRGNIKMGFDQLIAMVPALASQGNSKISKAAVLKKTVDYLVQIQRENDSMKEEQDRLRKEIENLNVEISVCQQQLPETGVMVNRQQDYNQMELFFNHYIQQRTEQNSKFWIFSSIMRPLFDAYNCTVSTANPEDFCRTVLAWLNEHCSLPKLRPSVLSSLREIIQKTSILSDPSKLPEQARLAANALEQRSAAEGRPR